jgi:hypothetical protein
MGSIYRATDSLSGQPVALKLLHVDNAEALQRFSREAHVLASLRHPGIVSYVAHGTDAEGRHFLAMEWLEGEDLAQRLARQPLSLEHTLALVRSAAQALAVAHQRGVIHRDLKPSNLFLRHGRPEQGVLLDFGLARHVLPSSALTASQMVVGTPGYMAPEQASSQSEITPSADIFSLGCILYECLTGKPPFAAPHFVAALAKILFSEPEPLRSVRPELPVALEELLQRMLAKAPERRLPDGSSLVAALAQVEPHLGAEFTAPGSASALHLAEAEQQLVSVLLASPLSATEPSSPQQDSRRSVLEALRSLLSPHGAQVELLADGSLAATLVAAHGSATDPAALAARCALFLQERWPQATVVLTTGRGRRDQHRLMGEAMDHAGQLLRQLPPPPDSPAPVLLDEVTAGLLGPGFQLTRSPSGLFLLQGEQLGADASRLLLGKPTPCVGREQELATLELAFATCARESIAQGVLVMAPPGAGKSRLRHEFLRRLEHQGHPVQVLLGRGDPMSAGSADGLMAQALRRLCDIPGGAPLEVRRARLSQRLAQHLPASQPPDAVAFLGELCGIPFPDEHHPRLRAARGDPRLMSTQIGRALVAFLRAECAQHPVLLMLEDLHWGDALSVGLMDEALRELADEPFMVLALARPEVEQLLGPKLGRLQSLQLRALSRKAGARLVNEVLGSTVPDSLIDRLVEQAAGNALFLEELIRGVAEGRGEATPQTVLAMLQARLGRLDSESRQVLLAASFLGRAFWSGGVRALLSEGLADLEHRLQLLVEQEWIERQPDSRFSGQEEYRFRHALVRDAAYGLVLDSHKPQGHRLAGEWLEQVGETDARVLAEHALQGQQPERALHFYTLAAEKLFERYDMPAMNQCVEVALALGARGAGLTRLHALQATTAFWTGDFVKLFELGTTVLAELKPGSQPWCWLSTGLCVGSRLANQPELAASFAQQLLRAQPEPAARVAYLDAVTAMGFMAILCGIRPESAAGLARLSEFSAGSPPENSMENGWFFSHQAHFSFYFEPRPWQSSLWIEQSFRGHAEMGNEREATTVQTLWGLTLEFLGDRTGAEVKLRESLALAERVGPLLRILYSRVHLAVFLADSPEPAAWQEALSLASRPENEHVPLFSGMAWLAKAKVAAHTGQLAEAEAHVRKACDLMIPVLFYQLAGWTVLTQVLLAQGRAAEARQVATRGVELLEQCGSEGVRAVGIRLALAEACLADGDTPAGEAALRKAVQCLRTRASDIPDEALRQRFLHLVPENARTLALARQHGGE